MKTVFVAGHNGMVGSALCRLLSYDRDVEVLTASRDELDLTSQAQTNQFFADNAIDEVYLAAAKVGGIYANNEYPADFIYQNLAIELNVINAAYQLGVEKLLFLGSSCIYPREAAQPMTESELLTGVLEQTNEPYAVAKIAGIKLCESYNRQYGADYRSVMPTNLYGRGDNYHPENSHVIPGMLQRFHQAKQNGDSQVIVWGTGNPMREFLHVDDMAAASVFVMNVDSAKYQKHVSSMCSHINVGTGVDCSIHDLALLIAEVVGFDGQIIFDDSKPDGTPRKLLNVSRINNMGWKSRISLKDGLKDTYQCYLRECK